MEPGVVAVSAGKGYFEAVGDCRSTTLYVVAEGQRVAVNFTTTSGAINTTSGPNVRQRVVRVDRVIDRWPRSIWVPMVAEHNLLRAPEFATGAADYVITGLAVVDAVMGASLVFVLVGVLCSSQFDLSPVVPVLAKT
jgi:hypothetical protein